MAIGFNFEREDEELILFKENNALKEEIKKLKIKIEDLENKYNELLNGDEY